MEEPQPMDYVLHSPEASTSHHLQNQQSPPTGCPYWRPDHTPNLPHHLPNPNQEPNPNHFRNPHPQHHLHHHHHPHHHFVPHYDPVHSPGAAAWLPNQSAPFQWSPTIPMPPPHGGYHSRNSSSEFYPVGGPPGPNRTSGPASTAPHQALPPTLPPPDHAFGYPFMYRHPTTVPRFPPNSAPFPAFGQERPPPLQAAPRGADVNLPALLPATPLPTLTHPSSNGAGQQTGDENSQNNAMSSSGESSPAGPSTNSFNAGAESPHRRSADESYPSNMPLSQPIRPSLLADGAGAPTTPPGPPNTERRRSHASRPRPVARMPAHASDYDSEDELDHLEDEHLRFIEQFGPAGPGYHELGAGESRLRAHQILRGQMSNKRVASRKAIASLESVDASTLSESERTCVICYNEFGVENPEGINEAPLRLPNCKHVFGDHCIKKWFEESDSCPYCRDKVPSELALPTTATLREYLRANNFLAAGSARLMGGGARPADQRRPGIPRMAEDTQTYVRIMAQGRDDDPNRSPPRSWQTGERRSPPSEGYENRRRTRPRHFRSPPSANGSHSRPSAFANLGNGAPNQQSPGRGDRGQLPGASQATWYPFSNDPHRSLTPLFARQFGSQARSYNYTYTAGSAGHVEFGSVPMYTPDTTVAYGRAAVMASYYGENPMLANPMPAGGAGNRGPSGPGWAEEQQAQPQQQQPQQQQPQQQGPTASQTSSSATQALPPMSAQDQPGFPRLFSPNNSWQ